MIGIYFTASAFKDFNEWTSIDIKIYNKIVELIKSIQREPFGNRETGATQK